MKKTFMTPKLKVVRIKHNDIICGSGGDKIGIGVGGGPGTSTARDGSWDDEDW